MSNLLSNLMGILMTYFWTKKITLVSIITVVLCFANATAGINSRACAVLDKRLGIITQVTTDSLTQAPDSLNNKPEPAKKSQLEEFEYLKKEGVAIGEDENGAVLLGFSMPSSFEAKSTDLKFDAKMNLHEIYKTLAPLLEKYPDMTVEVDGYTDDASSDKSSQKLSEIQALNVKSYLISQGLAKERINATGFGKQYPMFTNETAIGKSINRRIMIIAKREAPPKPEKVEEIKEEPKDTAEVKEAPKAEEETRNCIYIGVKAGFNGYTFYFGDDRDRYIKNGFGSGLGTTVLFPISEYFTIRPELSFYWRKLGSENWIDIPSGSASEFAVNVPIMLQFVPVNNLYLEAGPEVSVPILPKFTEKGPTINDPTTKRAYKDRAKIDVLVALGIGYDITEHFTADIKGAMSLTRVDTYEKSPFDRYAQYGLNLTYFFK